MDMCTSKRLVRKNVPDNDAQCHVIRREYHAAHMLTGNKKNIAK